jgi:Phage portal protein
LRLAFWNKPKPEDSEPVAEFMAVEVPPELRGVTPFGGRIEPRISRAEALQVPAVLRSRNLIAGTLATLPVHFFNPDREQDRLSGFLEQIDLDTTNATVLAATYEDLLFEGWSWWRINQFDFSLRPMHAKHVPVDTVAVDTEGTVRIDGVPVPDSELIRFDSPNPPLLVHAARAIRTCLRLDQTAARYADQPLPLNIFTPTPDAEDLSETEVDDMMDVWFLARQQRTDAYLPKSIKREQVSWTALDIQLHEQRQHAVLEIARAAGIDPEYLGVSTTSRTYMNAETERLNLLDFTLVGYVRTVEQRLSMSQVSPRGYYAKVNMDAFLRSDSKTRMETHEIAMRIGLETNDEGRALEDKPKLTAAEKAALAPKPAQPSLPGMPSANGNRPQEVANGR